MIVCQSTQLCVQLTNRYPLLKLLIFIESSQHERIGEILEHAFATIEFLLYMGKVDEYIVDTYQHKLQMLEMEYQLRCIDEIGSTSSINADFIAYIVSLKYEMCVFRGDTGHIQTYLFKILTIFNISH